MATDLEIQLSSHRSDPFPTSVPGGAVYGSVDAVMVDADVWGLASKVAKQGPLNAPELQQLAEMISGLASSIWAFPLRARPYYARLLLIATLAYDQSVPDDLAL